MNDALRFSEHLIMKYSPYLSRSLEVTIKNNFFNYTTPDLAILYDKLKSMGFQQVGGLWYKPGAFVPSPGNPSPKTPLVKHGNMKVDPRLAKLGGLL